jgi:hypothetical protein
MSRLYRNKGLALKEAASSDCHALKKYGKLGKDEKQIRLL